MDSFRCSINLMIDAYNRLIPTLQKVGIEVEEIKHISGEYELLRFFEDSTDEADSFNQKGEKALNTINEVS